MKLGIVSEGFPPDKYAGGIGRYYSGLIQELKKELDEIHVFTGTQKENEENIFFHSIKLKKFFLPPINIYLNSINYSKKFHEKLRKFKGKLDLIEAPIATLNSSSYSKNKFTPLITSIQTPLSQGLTKKTLIFDKQLVYKLEKELIQNSDSIVTATNYSKKGILKEYFKSDFSKITTIKQGINTEEFRPIKTEKEFNELIILFAGRIEPRKGLKVLIQAIPFVTAKVKVLVLGEKLNQKLSYQKEIINLIKKHSIKNIVFLGYQSDKKIIELYNKADLIVEPSFSESACYVLIEGMSCGKPVIASSVEGMKEIALNELQFQAGNYLKLAEKINFLIENQKERKNLGKKAREKIIKEYNIKNSAKQYIKLYNSLLDK
ncbi:glycosyltransferase family 4 protein [Candidatus Micrarchaeota archaeon]|nr:glycosyltransferase family 4 protein [Candidatus Micrarchaeota archaeon]